MNYFAKELLQTTHLLVQSYLDKPVTLPEALESYRKETPTDMAQQHIAQLVAWTRNSSLRTTLPKELVQGILTHIFTQYWSDAAHEEHEHSLKRDVRSFTQSFGSTLPYIAVQSALPLTFEEKKDMALTLHTLYGLSFPTFHAEASVLGGIRIFKDGICIDNSWQRKVDGLFQSLRTYTH